MNKSNFFNNMDKGKIFLAIAILLASIIFGGFYYASELANINEERKIREYEEREEEITLIKKKNCVDEAEEYSHLDKLIDPELQFDMYNNMYNKCLQSKGLK